MVIDPPSGAGAGPRDDPRRGRSAIERRRALARRAGGGNRHRPGCASVSPASSKRAVRLREIGARRPARCSAAKSPCDQPAEPRADDEAVARGALGVAEQAAPRQPAMLAMGQRQHLRRRRARRWRGRSAPPCRTAAACRRRRGTCPASPAPARPRGRHRSISRRSRAS